jgi:hypothetical protein
VEILQALRVAIDTVGTCQGMSVGRSTPMVEILQVILFAVAVLAFLAGYMHLGEWSH